MRNHQLPLSLRCGVTLLCIVGGAQAQDASGSGRRGWAVEPSVSLRQTFTDNQDLQAVKKSDAITEVTAGLRVSSGGGLLRGSLDYALTGSLYWRNNDANELRHFLNAAATAELIEGRAFVDMRGSYTQQAISAFGTQSPDSSLSERNQSDVGSLSISPYVRGRLGGAINYEARASAATTRAKGTDASDVDNASATLHLDSSARGAPLGWTADATHNVSDFKAGRRTFDSRLRAGLSYTIGREWRVGFTAGQERTDIRALDAESTTTWGANLEWTPSERTSLSANVEKRFFGNAHSLRFAHRTPNTAWAISDTRDISTSTSQGNASFGSAYDLFFRQFASVEPDAVRRDAMVRAYLQSNSINPNAVVIGGFLASAATLQRMQSASVALVGARNTVTLQATASRTERADQLTTGFDDLSSAREVRQRGLSLAWAHRLTPSSSINVTGAYQRSMGDLAAQQTTLKSISAAWSSPLGPRSNVSAGARHTEFESSSVPYDENAVFAAIRIAF